MERGTWRREKGKQVSSRQVEGEREGGRERERETNCTHWRGRGTKLLLLAHGYI